MLKSKPEDKTQLFINASADKNKYSYSSMNQFRLNETTILRL